MGPPGCITLNVMIKAGLSPARSIGGCTWSGPLGQGLSRPAAGPERAISSPHGRLSRPYMPALAINSLGLIFSSAQILSRIITVKLTSARSIAPK